MPADSTTPIVGGRSLPLETDADGLVSIFLPPKQEKLEPTNILRFSGKNF